MMRIFLLVNIFIISAISVVSLTVFPGVGIYIAGFSVVLFIFAALYDIYNLYAEELLSLAVAFPLLGLIAYILPFHNILYFSVSLYICLFVIASFYEIYLVKNSFSTITIKSMGLSILSGLFLLGLLNIIDSVSPVKYHITDTLFIGKLLILLECGIEVLFFQGLLQNQIQKFSDTDTAIGFCALFFTLFHFNGELIYTLFYLLLGLTIAAIYAFGKNLYAAIAIQTIVILGWFLLSGNLLL